MVKKGKVLNLWSIQLIYLKKQYLYCVKVFAIHFLLM